jgi:hypothetical protein
MAKHNKDTYVGYEGSEVGFVATRVDQNGSWTQGTTSVQGYVYGERVPGSPIPRRSEATKQVIIVTNPKRWYLLGRRSFFPKIGSERKISEAEKSAAGTIRNIALLRRHRRFARA